MGKIALLAFALSSLYAQAPIDWNKCTTTTSCSFVIATPGATSIFIQGGCVLTTCGPISIATVPVNALSCILGPTAGSGSSTVSGILCFTLAPSPSATVTVNVTACPAFCFAAGASFSGTTTQDGSIASNASMNSPTYVLSLGPVVPTGTDDLVISGVAVYCQGTAGTLDAASSFIVLQNTCDPSVMGGAIAYKVSSVSEFMTWFADNGDSGALGMTGQMVAVKRATYGAHSASYGCNFGFQQHFGFSY